MNLFDVVFAGVLVPLLVVVISIFLTAVILFILPKRRYEVMRWPISLLAGTAGITIGLPLITSLYVLNDFAFAIPDPGRHACGGPYVEGAAACEAKVWDEWIQKSHIVEERFTGWLLTPPPLRESCDWVLPRLCDLIKQKPWIGSWGEYVFMLLTIVEAGLACTLSVNWFIRFSMRQRNEVLYWKRDWPVL